MSAAARPRAPDVVVRDTFDPDEFAASLWERRVVRFRAGAVPAFTDGEVFAAALAAARVQERRSYPPEARPPVQFTRGRLQQLALGPWAPRRADRSIAGYESRMRRSLGAEKYALVVADLHAHSFSLWAREQAFLAELWRRLGLPISGAITTLFHGNYEHTPVGVHRDRFGTFLCLLRGHKRMRFWADKPWTEPVSSKLDYRAHLRTSFAVELAPGEALYWPSRYYHVGESVDAHPATSVNVGIPVAQHHTSYYLDDLALGAVDEHDLPEQARAATRLRARAASPLVQRALAQAVLPARLPPPLTEAIAAYASLGEPAAARRHLRATWLRRVSATGLEPAPAAAPPRPLPPTARVRRDPRFALYWTRAGERGSPLLCCGNGHVVELADSPASVALLRLLAGPKGLEEHQVRALLRRFPLARGPRAAPRPDDAPLPATSAGARALLETLLSFRVLRRSASRRSPRSRP